jgi:antitoxin component of RelBE/YafQ-DinJ toxin-antitoxin module
MKKDKYIQIRINDQLKKDFQTILNENESNMSEALTYAITHAVKDAQAPYTQLCIKLNNQQPSPINDDDHLDQITNLDYTPTLKNLLKELMKARYEEYACLSDECLLELYTELLNNQQLYLLFEREHMDNRIKNEWSGLT